MITIHKLTAGDGYTYLIRQVAGGDVQWERGQASAEYYTAKGNPPGRWIGRGAPLLGLAGEQVTEAQMQALYGSGMHPDADLLVDTYLASHIKTGMTERQLQLVRAGAIRAATLGRRFPEYEPLEHFQSRVGKRLEVIEEETRRPATATDVKRVQAEESRRARAAVAGFDVVFAPVKSAALLWALDPRLEVRRAVRQAHEAARDAALALLEEHAAFTRTGAGGVAQIQTNGLIAALFDHYDSRGGDPNLHTHVAISSKVQGVDGVWRSLDARALYRITVAASEFYNTAFETELHARIPVTFAVRSDTRDEREPIREIAGIPLEWIEFFSSRRTEIEARYEQLLRTYRREHGHDPNRQVAHQLARRANLDTRDPKKTARSLEEMRADWTESFTTAFGLRAIGDLLGAVPDGPPRLPEPLAHVDVAGLAGRVVAGVAEMRSTWTVWNLRAEAERLARSELVFASPDEHQATVAAIVAETLSRTLCVPVDGPELPDEPVEPKALRRGDGSSVFTEHTAARYTSRLILDAEDRLVAAARTRTAVSPAGTAVAAALEGFDGQMAADVADGLGGRLDAGQRQLVTAFAADDRLLVAGLGPAGAGKTTAMRAYAHVAAHSGQRILALATSSAAAGVLGKELGVRADNLHKFVHEYTVGAYAARLRAGQQVPAPARFFALKPGDVVLVDEAGMAGTLLLDRLVQIAVQRGAVVRLLGDWRQLGAVESGGALRLICNEVGAVELTTLYRFNNPAEAEATLKLRVGDTSGLDFYTEHSRIRSGSKQAMIEGAYAAWKTDMLAGKTTLMAAATGVNVTELSAQARRDRIEAGQVEPEGMGLHDGNTAGTGDWIVTRHNDRRLRVRGEKDWVKNGDGWQILARHDDGSLTARHLEHHGHVVLPAAYVAANVELLYATTTNRAQGSTVDTAHPLVTPDMTRENLYVIATRARQRTVLHVVTHELLAYDPDDRTDFVKNDARQYAAREVLENILAREGNEISGTESIRQAADDAMSLARWVPRHQHAATLLASHTYARLAHQVLARPLAHTLTTCENWPQTVAALAAAEAAGWPARQLLAATARDADLLTADTPGRLLAYRITTYVQDRPAPRMLAQPSLADTTRYADMLRPLAGQQILNPADATQPPTLLTGGTREAFVSSQRLTDYARATGAALGIPAGQVTAHPSWPHLAASLAAADRTGRDIPGLVGPLTATLAQNPSDTPHAGEKRRPVELSTLARTVRRLLVADPATGPITIPYQLKHAVTVLAALGEDLAQRLRGEPSWPALDAALRRAEYSGHDPVDLLRRVVHVREFCSVDSISRVLARRLGRYTLTVQIPNPATNEQAVRADWRQLAWTLKALEDAGTDLSAVVPRGQAATLDDLLPHVQAAAQASDHHHSGRVAPLPWLISAGRSRDPRQELTNYLTDTEIQIANRVQHLADHAITGHPAWSTPLGAPPEPEEQRAEWTRNVGIVAAYRDQQHVITDDPRQILGPYAEPGRPEHTAYWHAVNAIATARRLAGLDSQSAGTSPDRVRVQMAIDLYKALPEEERQAVQVAIIQRRGDLWFGDRHTLDDHAVTQPANADTLHDVMVQQGHLTRPETQTADQAAIRQHRQTVDRPVEADLTEHRRTRQDTERATRLQAARKAKQRAQNRRNKQQHPDQKTHDAQPNPPLQPPSPRHTQQYERQFDK